MTEDEILTDFPSLKREHIRAALAYASGEGEVEAHYCRSALRDLEDLMPKLKNCKASRELLDELRQATDRLEKFM